MAISKHLLFSVLFLVGILLASSEPADNRRPSSRPPSPRPPPPRPPSPRPPPPRPQSPPPPRPSPPPPRPPPPPPPRPSPPPPPTPSPPPPSPPPNPPGFDYFLLTLQWPNAFCTPSDICKPPKPKQYFTIHGLWPQKNYGPPPHDCDTNEEMTDAILKKFQKDLLEYWPRLFSADDFGKSKKLWKERWKKHGSCSSKKFPPEAYLGTTIALGKKYGPLILNEMVQQGIKQDRTTPHTEKEILDAIKAATKTAALLTCTNDNFGNVQLDDIRLCVEADGKTLQDCKSKSPRGKCSNGFIFPPPPNTTHSRFPSFVSSMLDVEEAVGI